MLNVARRAVDIGPFDVILLAMGTHKLSRTLIKDAVTSPLRAPLTRYSDTGGRRGDGGGAPDQLRAALDRRAGHLPVVPRQV